MEYIIIISLLFVAAITLYANKVDKDTALQSVKKDIGELTVDLLKKNEAEIVQGAYNTLPSSVKSKVSSDVFAQVISYGIDVSTKVIEEEIKK